MTRKKGEKEEPEVIPDASEDKKDVKEEKTEEVKAQNDEEIRIGVYVCHCGLNIGAVVDCEAVSEYAKTLDGVVVADHPMYSCSEPGQQQIKNDIKEHKLNRVVVASCSPKLHEPTFRAACEEAGLNKYLFEMANLREQDSWVHLHEKEEATEKKGQALGAANRAEGAREEKRDGRRGWRCRHSGRARPRRFRLRGFSRREGA
jgi:hypothetical protein